MADRVGPDPAGEGADIGGRADIEALVRDFYRTAFTDPLIGPIFTDVARLDLTAHLPTMCDFWETVLFNAGTYRGNALQLHRDLHARFPLRTFHFDRWLTIWQATVDRRHAGPVADRAKLQATRIALSIQRRLLGFSGSEFATIRRRERTPVPGAAPTPAPRPDETGDP